MIKQYDLKQDINSKGKVYLGIPRERVYIPWFVDNRDQIMAYLQQKDMFCDYHQTDGHRVDSNRDRIVTRFLEHPDKPEWLQFLDSDMDHPASISERLAKWKKPIVAGLYFSRNESREPFIFDQIEDRKDEYGQMSKMWAARRDQVYNFFEENDVPYINGGIVIDDCVSSPLVECDAVATGTMLIHRSVLELMEKPVFQYRAGGNSEDMTFCYEAKNHYGIPIYCDLSTVSGHYILVPVGQSQFRELYEKRGVHFSSYTKREIAELLAEYLGISFDKAVDKINKSSSSIVGDYWENTFKGKEPTEEEVDSFYRNEYVGKLYLLELIHWNFSETFFGMKSSFKRVRGKKVLEIGSGIGSLTMQLAIQKCDVVSSEINDTLIEFSKLRLSKLDHVLASTIGDVTFVKDEWRNHEENTFEVVVSTDTFEHVPENTLKKTLKDISKVLEPGGSLLYHVNFKQQDAYPMHYDHSDMWDTWLIEAGFIPLNSSHAIKQR